MPIDNVQWTNCRKCGHRYGKHIPRCPRCETKTQRISGKVVAGIAAGAGIVVMLYVLSNGAIQNIQESLASNIATVGSNLPSNAREPIAVYENCLSALTGYNTDKRYNNIRTDCYDRKLGFFEGTSAMKLADFKFTYPSQLGSLTTIRSDSAVYQYGENDFEIGLYDEVGEKRYSVKLWELPQ